MKKMLEFLINKHHKEELSLLFGERSYLKIQNITWSTNSKNYVIHTKLLVDDVEKSVEAYPEGADFLITESLKFIGLETDPVIINSIELNDKKD